MNAVARRKTAQPPRLVFDTGVLLRALLLSDARAQRLRQSWQDGACVPLIGTASAQALIRALAYPALALEEAQRHELLADFLPYAEVVKVSGNRRAAASPLLSLALEPESKADGFVSDCVSTRARFARSISRSGTGLCRLLGSDEFMAVT